jgi:glutathione peroxidase
MALLGGSGGTLMSAFFPEPAAAAAAGTLWALPLVALLDGGSLDLATWAGRPALIFNSASKCGYTDANLKGLQALATAHPSLHVLGFPCDQFGVQEYAAPADIAAFARDKYGVSFPLAAPVDVNGPAAHPVFAFLKASSMPASGADVGWNFEKWLVGADGRVVQRWGSDFEAASVEAAVAAELAKAGV